MSYASRLGSTAVAAGLLLFVVLALGQNQQCIKKGQTLQEKCKDAQSVLRTERKLIGVSRSRRLRLSRASSAPSFSGRVCTAGATDAELQKAADDNSSKINKECCTSLNEFLGDNFATCGCDDTIVAGAKAQGVNTTALVTLGRAAKFACAKVQVTIKSVPASDFKCPAKSG